MCLDAWMREFHLYSGDRGVERDAGIRRQTQCLAGDQYLLCTVLLIFVPQPGRSLRFQIQYKANLRNGSAQT